MSDRTNSLITPQGEYIWTIPGDRGPKDMKILSGFQKFGWPHSMYYVGLILRIKGEVEDRNYKDLGNGRGREYLWEYLRECMFSDVPIRSLCNKYKMPGVPAEKFKPDCIEDINWGRFTKIRIIEKSQIIECQKNYEWLEKRGYSGDSTDEVFKKYSQEQGRLL